jgi:hypothetical protein
MFLTSILFWYRPSAHGLCDRTAGGACKKVRISHASDLKTYSPKNEPPAAANVGSSAIFLGREMILDGRKISGLRRKNFFFGSGNIFLPKEIIFQGRKIYGLIARKNSLARKIISLTLKIFFPGRKIISEGSPDSGKGRLTAEFIHTI